MKTVTVTDSLRAIIVREYAVACRGAREAPRAAQRAKWAALAVGFSEAHRARYGVPLKDEPR